MRGATYSLFRKYNYSWYPNGSPNAWAEMVVTRFLNFKKYTCSDNATHKKTMSLIAKRLYEKFGANYFKSKAYDVIGIHGEYNYYWLNGKLIIEDIQNVQKNSIRTRPRRIYENKKAISVPQSVQLKDPHKIKDRNWRRALEELALINTESSGVQNER
jgi:hypothetical protein